MYGLEAINDAHGWQMAALGVSIVFSSLIVLSIVISQLHNLLELWEKRKTLLPAGTAPDADAAPPTVAPDDDLLPHPPVCPTEIAAVATLWDPLIQQLDAPFTLQALYKAADANRFPHPHLTVNRLRDAGFLAPAGDGRFTWKHA
ncbi:OadG family protein [Desulfatitalea alkaliphila]|uniref:OadG family protein n=1 Tax=Desulfatitalea alkaliphila TaxID=2929485 RepID=A0AA41UMI8_9BACT|nr:OadG family protein [Desulfatitalea alkaliphila]MCJ8502651.1 OadG family protein [Desulfatitalea alkaliphila]